MKIYAFSDAHESFNFLKKIKNSITQAKPDLILFCGDFLNSGSTQEYVIDLLDALEETQIPIFAVRGNADDDDTALILEKKGINLENKTVEFEDETLSGFSPDATKPFSKNFNITQSIVMSHHPISMPSKKLSGAPKIWISGHLHRYWMEKKFDTLYIHLPAANTLKAVIIDTKTLKCKMANL